MPVGGEESHGLWRCEVMQLSGARKLLIDTNNEQSVSHFFFFALEVVFFFSFKYFINLTENVRERESTHPSRGRGQTPH